MFKLEWHEWVCNTWKPHNPESAKRSIRANEAGGCAGPTRNESKHRMQSKYSFQTTVKNKDETEDRFPQVTCHSENWPPDHLINSLTCNFQTYHLQQNFPFLLYLKAGNVREVSSFVAVLKEATSQELVGTLNST